MDNKDLLAMESSSKSEISSPRLHNTLYNNESSAQDSCSSHTNCTGCYKSSYGCHWCTSDNQCHAKGSIHGCAVGSSCDSKNSTDDNSCHSHTNCTECYKSSYGCHWCTSDNQCHAKGSIHGCAVGSSCDSKNSTNDKSCHSHTNCTECYKSSFGCHWCEFDNQCHAIGSIHGCAQGVNCNSNHRCQRQTPERKSTSLSISPVIDCLILGISFSLLFCCTFCFCGIRNIYKAVELDCAEAIHSEVSQDAEYSQMNTPLLPSELKMSEGQNSLELSSSIVSENKKYINESVEEHAAIAEEESKPSLEPNQQTNRAIPKSFKSAQAIYSSCKYFFSMVTFTVIVTTILVILYFPRIPVINVCGNEMQWKSIINGLTSLKVQASFQILVSIYNPNRIAVNLSSLTGTITHDGDFIGTYEIPPDTLIAAQSITDVLSTVTITPGKWEAVELTTEYYKGTLTVLLDVHASAELLALKGYTYGYESSGILEHINNEATQSTELCACSIEPKVESEFTQNEVIFIEGYDVSMSPF